jgi:hypothetical protein
MEIDPEARAKTIVLLAACLHEARAALEAGDIERAKAALDFADAEFKKIGGYRVDKLPGRD